MNDKEFAEFKALLTELLSEVKRLPESIKDSVDNGILNHQLGLAPTRPSTGSDKSSDDSMNWFFTIIGVAFIVIMFLNFTGLIPPK